MSNKPSQSVQSLERAFDILEKLVESNKSLGVTELSNSLGLHKSTVYRILATLAYRGYVKQDPDDNRYKIGLKLFEIGSNVLNNLDLRSQVKPFLKKIMEETGETVHLGIIDGYEAVYIDKVESSKTIRMYSKIGRRAPVHCTSLGKALLAFSPDSLITEIIEKVGLTAYTENTITDAKELKKHLEEIREKGYAIDNEEHEKDIRCIAGPIFDFKGDIITAFSIAGPAIRMTEERVEKLKDRVNHYSREISTFFGYNGDQS